MNILLYPLSPIYRMLVSVDRMLTSRRNLLRPVISVGNITWGGTGKTSFVIKIAKDLIASGLKPAILTRGYLRKDKNSKSIAVSDRQRIIATPEEAGDEPYLIAQSAPGSIVIVGADRCMSADLAIKNYSPDIFILDDGFQHWRVNRDLDIVCINAVDPFGNGTLIPSGILREPVSSLKRANLVVLTNTEHLADEALKKLEAKIEKITSKVPLRAVYNAVAFRQMMGDLVYSLNDFPHRSIIAMSALGENGNFINTLKKHKLNIKKHFAFKDHHWYNQNDINTVILNAAEDSAIVTTAKDAVKLDGLLDSIPYEKRRKIFVLDVKLQITSGEEYWKKELKRILQFS
ncbi:MAG: tetraacyldisaccharide 4'-kinase [Endomicrobiales bacterium]|nr:tetraacyldisaccharide 4'-kinase [Endomicrobiales bacterium]